MQSHDKKNEWDDIAQHYADHVSRFTSLFADDLIHGCLLDIIQSATTILDVGCGPGVFALAYLKQFPKGIPGQTLICSDLSQGMVLKAQSLVEAQLPDNNDFQTNMQFQVEDGSILSGIPDGSISLVVSVFGIFLFPDRQKTFQAIQRVLAPGGVLATTAWTSIETPSMLVGFGPNFHEVVDHTTAELTSFFHKDAPWKEWFDPVFVREQILQDYFQHDDIQIHRSIHTTTWPSPSAFWNLFVSNPMSRVQTSDPVVAERAKNKLMDLVGHAPHKPVFVWMAANLIVARRLQRNED
jgi:ubiquinone/menaquinone biosynthesis C-methylase UbiE